MYYFHYTIPYKGPGKSNPVFFFFHQLTLLFKYGMFQDLIRIYFHYTFLLLQERYKCNHFISLGSYLIL